MSFDVETSLSTIKSALEGMSPQRFVLVRIGNPPKAVLPAGYTSVLTMDRVEVAETTLVSTIEVHTVSLRIYRSEVAAPDQEDALMRYRIVPEVMDLLKGDFSIGGTVRAIDWGGQYGTRPQVDFDEEEIADKPYWTAHLTLPLIVDPAAVFVA